MLEKESMITFDLSEDQKIARSMFHDLAADAIRPVAAHQDVAGAVSADVLQILHNAGLVQALLDGDNATSPLHNSLLLEELGWADTAVATLTGATLGYLRAVLSFGTAEQIQITRRRYLDGTFRAGVVLAQEPGFGAGLNALKTYAVATPDGYRLSGTKTCLPSVSGCDDLIVIARLDGGHAAFLVDRNDTGVQCAIWAGTLGLRALRLGEIRFDDVILPASARLGEGRDTEIQLLINAARLGVCAILTGLSRAVFEHILPYTKERVVHGTPLAQKQSVAFRLSDMAIDVPAMRWSTWRGAVALAKGRAVDREARLAQIYCSRQAFAIADEGVQLMGGHGYMRENPVERWYRDARTLSLFEGIVGI
jgi:alkylation response protein AidB-like acyl-CoA dehydrogenase